MQLEDDKLGFMHAINKYPVTCIKNNTTKKNFEHKIEKYIKDNIINYKL